MRFDELTFSSEIAILCRQISVTMTLFFQDKLERFARPCSGLNKNIMMLHFGAKSNIFKLYSTLLKAMHILTVAGGFSQCSYLKFVCRFTLGWGGLVRFKLYWS